VLLLLQLLCGGSTSGCLLLPQLLNLFCQLRAALLGLLLPLARLARRAAGCSSCCLCRCCSGACGSQPLLCLALRFCRCRRLLLRAAQLLPQALLRLPRPLLLRGRRGCHRLNLAQQGAGGVSCAANQRLCRALCLPQPLLEV
jgi:hypothetical protein